MNGMIQYRWVILGIILFCQLAQSISFQSTPPILAILIQKLDISYAQAGGLMSLYSFPRIILALASGILVDRYGTKKVGRFALLTLSLGTGMFAIGNSYWFLALGRLLAGIGTTFFLVAALHAVTTWFRGREVGLSMGSYHTAMPLGTILSLNFVGVFAARFGWRAPMATIFILCATAFLLFTVCYRERNAEMDVRPEPLNPMKILRQAGWRIWMVGAMWTLLSGAIVPYFTYAPDFFVSQGKDDGEAGLLASYPMWASVLAPFVGLMIDRLGRKRLLNHIGFICCAALYFLIPRFAQYATIFAITIGIFAAIQPTAIYSLPAELLPPSATGIGFGIIATCGALGMAIGPFIAGSLRDLTGDYLWSFNAMAIISALGIVPTLLVKWRFGKKGHP